MMKEDIERLATLAEELANLRANGLPPTKIPTDREERKLWAIQRAREILKES